MNIGKDILCTTTNTLMFAFLGDFMTLLIWFYKGDYTFLDVVNAKTFAAELIRILFSAIGCILVIPISAYITTNALIKIIMLRRKKYECFNWVINSAFRHNIGRLYGILNEE